MLVLIVSYQSTIPITAQVNISQAAAAIKPAIPLSLLLSLLFSVNHARKKKVNTALTFIILLITSLVFTYSACLGLYHAKNMSAPPFFLRYNANNRSNESLIVNNTKNKSVLLSTPLDTQSPVVVLGNDGTFNYFPDGAEFEKSSGSKNNLLFEFAGIRERTYTNPFPVLENILRALHISVDIFEKFFLTNPLIFCLYTLSFVLLVILSLYIIPFSIWGMAIIFVNLFILRGLLFLQTFLYESNFKHKVYLFLGSVIDADYIQIVLFSFASMVLLFFLLIRYFLGDVKSGK